MAIDGNLSAKQERSILALLSTRNIEAAAHAAKVGYRTLWRWLKEDPVFIAAYRTARATAVEHAISRLQQSSSEAVGILTAIMNDTEAPPAVRVTAATKILEMAIKGTEMAELQRRVEELENSHDVPLDEAQENDIVTTH